MRHGFLVTALILAVIAASLALQHSYASEPVGTVAMNDVAFPAFPDSDQPSADDTPVAPSETNVNIAVPTAYFGVPHTLGCGLPRTGGDFVEQIEGRSYRVHVPGGYNAIVPTALVVNFHGYGRTAAAQETYSGLVPLSDREGFILVTPEGSGAPQGWDIVGIYAEDGVDDVAFVASLVGRVGDEFCLAPGRVFAIGMSNGAEMASQLACDLPDTFAAVAAVAGLVYQGCEGGPVAVVAFHGTADQNILYDWIPAARTGWVSHNGCTGTETTQVSEHVSAQSAIGCTNGADVVFYTIDDGGHTWPGAEDNAGGVGLTTHEIDASELAWKFFATHARN